MEDRGDSSRVECGVEAPGGADFCSHPWHTLAVWCRSLLALRGSQSCGDSEMSDFMDPKKATCDSHASESSLQAGLCGRVQSGQALCPWLCVPT